MDGEVRRERARVLQAEADRRKELLANPPNTGRLREAASWARMGDSAMIRNAALWIDAVTATEPAAPESDTEWVPLAESVGRIAAQGNRQPRFWTITHVTVGGWAATKCGRSVSARWSDGMVEVVK